METSYTWDALGDGAARMTLRNRGAPTDFSKLVAPFIASAVRRANQKVLAMLKLLLEHQDWNLPNKELKGVSE